MSLHKSSLRNTENGPFTLSHQELNARYLCFHLISSISLTTELRPFQSCRLSGQNGAWLIKTSTRQPEIELVYGRWSMKNNHGQWLTAWYLEDTFWVLQACLLCTFQTLSEHLLNNPKERELQRCSRCTQEAHLYTLFAYVNCTNIGTFCGLF